MAQHAGYARVAFNFALSSFKVGLDPDEWRSHIDIKREFNAVKYDKFDWCEDLSQNASKNAIHNLGDAVTRWKKGQNKFPVYKNRSGKCSYQADNGQGTVEVCKKRVNLPKIGWIRMREELRYSGEITKVVVSKCTRNDKWYVSITVRRLDSSNYKHQPPLFDDKEPIGIDVGINTLATCSNGDTYDNPRPLKRYERKLARDQPSVYRVVKKVVRIGIKRSLYSPLSTHVLRISVKTLTTKQRYGLSVKPLLSVSKRSKSLTCLRTGNLQKRYPIQHLVAF